MRELTDRQERFVEEYICDLNGTQAAKRAGYSHDSARQIATELLARDDVSEAIAELKAKRSARTMVTADRVMAELAKIAFANVRDLMRFTSDGDPVVALDTADRDDLAAVASIEVHDYADGRGDDRREVKAVKFRMHNKPAALHELGRHLGLVTKHEHAGPGGAPIAVEDKTPINDADIVRRLALLFTQANRKKDAAPDA